MISLLHVWTSLAAILSNLIGLPDHLGRTVRWTAKTHARRDSVSTTVGRLLRSQPDNRRPAHRESGARRNESFDSLFRVDHPPPWCFWSPERRREEDRPPRKPAPLLDPSQGCTARLGLQPWNQPGSFMNRRTFFIRFSFSANFFSVSDGTTM
jgi:hypothetical protein